MILLSLSFHEFSHAFISYRLGDPTAKNMGRLTLNPLKHLDILGTIMMLVARIGWAKPVPINPMYYKNRKRGTMLVSLAGPLSNILLATIFAFPLIYISYKYAQYGLSSTHPIILLYNLSIMFFRININLAIFNILPVPPLDGSKILSGILPQQTYFRFMRYENYIGIAFLIIVFIFPGQLYRVLSFLAAPVQNAILGLVNPIVGLFL